MASIKVKFRPSTVANCPGSIYFQISHRHKVRQLKSRYRIYPDEWNKSRSMVSVDVNSSRAAIQMAVRNNLLRETERLNSIIRKLDSTLCSYTADDIVYEYNRYIHDYSFCNFVEQIITSFKKNGRVRTAETYRTTLNSFMRFLSRRDILSDSDIMLDSITGEILEDYEAWLHNCGLIPNTISFYTRILRAVYNRAVENGAIENRYPFRHVYTGIDKTVKRALSISNVRKLRALNLHDLPSLDYARDMFMLSFYLRGMSFIDMSYLRKTDFKNGYITYRRRKTGQQLIVKWTHEMQLIVDKYPVNSSEYLLPIITSSVANARSAYRNASYNINRNLKKIAAMVGITIPLTLYVARHSWASAAKAKGIPLSIISEGMGHDSESTTQIYLASLDTSLVDRANRLILQSL